MPSWTCTPTTSSSAACERDDKRRQEGSIPSLGHPLCPHLAEQAGAEVRDLQFLVAVLEGYHGGSTLAEAGKIVAAQQLAVNSRAERFMDENPQGSLKSTMNNRDLNA